MNIVSKMRLGATAAFAATVLGMGVAQAGTNLTETGSSLLYPLFNLWVPDYTAAHPGVQITTTSSGSGTGIAQSMKGLVQIGASDAYLSNAVVKMHPNMVCIPLAISSQAINYNLPGLNDKNIQLSGPILAGIYSGKITKWNDPAIAAANPGVDLPDHTIIPIHRLDGSGDTFIFTQYLTKSTPSWASTVKFGTSVPWPPVAGGIGANGNSGMVTALASNPYGVAYIGVSYAQSVAKDGLGVAKLEDADGEYVLPNAQTVGAAASSVASSTPADERVSMIFAKGQDAYPIANYEYAIINTNQSDAATAKAVREFLTWAVTDGNNMKYLSKVHFLPLPAAIVKLSEAQIAKIH